MHHKSVVCFAIQHCHDLLLAGCSGVALPAASPQLDNNNRPCRLVQFVVVRLQSRQMGGHVVARWQAALPYVPGLIWSMASLGSHSAVSIVEHGARCSINGCSHVRTGAGNREKWLPSTSSLMPGDDNIDWLHCLGFASSYSTFHVQVPLLIYLLLFFLSHTMCIMM
jgi:hypothetical protein